MFENVSKQCEDWITQFGERAKKGRNQRTVTKKLSLNMGLLGIQFICSSHCYRSPQESCASLYLELKRTHWLKTYSEKSEVHQLILMAMFNVLCMQNETSLSIKQNPQSQFPVKKSRNNLYPGYFLKNENYSQVLQLQSYILWTIVHQKVLSYWF